MVALPGTGEGLPCLRHAGLEPTSGGSKAGRPDHHQGRPTRNHRRQPRGSPVHLPAAQQRAEFATSLAPSPPSLDIGQGVGLTATLGIPRARSEIDCHLGIRKIGDQIDATVAPELVVACAAIEQVGTVAAVQRVDAAQTFKERFSSAAGKGGRASARPSIRVVVVLWQGVERLNPASHSHNSASKARSRGLSMIPWSDEAPTAQAGWIVDDPVSTRNDALVDTGVP